MTTNLEDAYRLKTKESLDLSKRISLPAVAPSNVTSPVKVPPARGILVAIELVTVVEKLASSPSAAASSFNVFKVLGAESAKFAIGVSV